MTLSAFIENNRITMDSEWADSNPHFADPSPGMSHYKCLLRHRRARFTVYFSMGSAHTKEPTAAEVLDCLASDASGIDNAPDFENWASEYGYDTDSRKAEKIFKTCETQAAKLRRFLGDDLYQELLWKVERE